MTKPMLSLIPCHNPSQILLLGAHSDDIEIGCGTTILKLVAQYPQCEFVWVVFCSNQARADEARASAAAFLDGASQVDIRILSFRDGFLPWSGIEAKEAFETLKRETAPDLIFTHTKGDQHQDHRTLSELTWNTWRDHCILEYEIPKYDGDLGQPNCYISANHTQVEEKISYLMHYFSSQSKKHWFSPETFRALLRLRGIESGVEMAEAFHFRKQLLFEDAVQS
jgi:LmbE family N-acetylglucosaminyl deacetylase